ncbi:MAG: hypothetical protein II716_09065 [Treponema sp.]|nr:hypothetical protein [Treponema sp.]MBQ5384784.1 hypothetical protein [Treponema sp.]MBQ5472836.1 hypothetical protein [Treponema sp.]
MNAIKKLNINDFVQIRTLGLEALKDALGVVGATRFLQQYDTGYGDYTKEKYTREDESAEDIYKQLKEY